ncbi:PREDICTED: uncharacterized protein LOC104603774 isoform X2 [Nelumbo nucifera]|uniref:Lethal giant larvae (Lgl)-like C-terminal domain-containing protein n=2 Tax=Nelumbo nucifera TaxID=4432 RepID=A0A822ZB97_NELNU|nr:PREDICTED: uncharacterized protein LOC104603774 isoform X2 [Nelumbo nucifera]DAD41833.1 TPA_asm: hypothetical protein HUJ06_016156 [Nelumbo nucifera]
MFVKKLVEKASKKPAGGNFNGIKSDDVNPRLVFHYGIPAGSISLAYDSIQKILAISTKDGRIKLFGKSNTQALLESNEAVPSKFLKFIENQGILLNVTIQNRIEVWDIRRKQLSHVHSFKEEITSLTVIQQTLYMYVGDSGGNISVLKLDQESCQLVQMKYYIPFSATHGNNTEVASETAVVHILPQPMAESKRVLIIFRDGLITLWEIQECKVNFVTGGNILHSLRHETKQVTSACWACPFGSKVVVGYGNGEILLWNIPTIANLKSELLADREEVCFAQNVPLRKLNLGYKMDNIPIVSLKWAYANGKASRLYVNGASSASTNSLQVITLNENTDAHTIKLMLPLPEPCIDMEIISCTGDPNKHKQDSLVVLLKSGHLYIYDDFTIEQYLLQCQSRSPPSIPREVPVKLPFVDSSITVAKYITDNRNLLRSLNEDYVSMAKDFPQLLPTDMKGNDRHHLSSSHFSGFEKIRNLYITGHCNGSINFWDLSCPFLLPIASIKQQSEDEHSLSGIPVTALYFDSTSWVLVSGDQNGVVRIFKLKPKHFSTETNILSLQGSTKKGSSQIILSVKLIKINRAVLSINTDCSSRYLAVGSDQGYISLIDMEGLTVLFQKHIASEFSNDVISLEFNACRFHGFEKNVLFVATKDSSVLALESDSGNTLSTSMVHPKKPSRALFMKTLGGQDMSDNMEIWKANSVEDSRSKQSLLLFCSEKSVYLYSLMHVVQGVKKVYQKKKFHESCCFASTLCTPQFDGGLILLFTSGKIEIRSLPELYLLKETSIRGFTLSNSKPNSRSNSSISICSSSSGELVLVNADQEVFFVSIFQQKEIYRLLDPISEVYKNDVMDLHDDPASGSSICKEKKKGIFSSIIKDIKGNKASHNLYVEAEDSRATIEELSAIFSTDNFLLTSEKMEEISTNDNEIELSIDDINLEDPDEKPRGHNMVASNKQKLSNKFHEIKGKLKQIKVRNEKTSSKEEHEDEKVSAIDQIKKKYGFPLTGESSIAKMAENKLSNNLRKLQGISMRTSEMQDTAQSYSALAKEVLQIAEQNRRSL